MKLLKSLVKVLATLIVLFLIALFFISRQYRPTYEGELDLGLNKSAEVYFDSYGIPHIYADTNEDAYKTLGYVHAQDRLWQMELLRRIAPGKLSEVFGEKTLADDKFFRTIGISQQSKRLVDLMEDQMESTKLLNAYIEGVNSFIDTGFTPVEYTILGLEKQHFNQEDIYNIIGYMAFSFAAAQKTDPLVTYIQTKLGNEYLTDLMLDYDPDAVFIENEDERFTESSIAYSSHISNLLDHLPIPTFDGSNSWVVNKDKTQSGKVILANDPHIGYAQPAVWFEAHLSTPTYERYGYHLGGVPFPLLSHNRSYAFGLTMFENDDIDFYQEHTNADNPSQYKTDQGWEVYQTREETIVVADADPVQLTVRETHHGPIVNDVVPGLEAKDPISMYWIYTQIDKNLVETIYKMNNANSMEDFESRLPDLHAPGLNVMYGDADGNIAWWATAQLYKRLDNNHSKMIKQGVFDKDKHLEMTPFENNPHAVNPSSGYVYSANNAARWTDGTLVPGYYAPENRAKRIVNLLDAKDNWNRESISEMIVDDTSAVLPATLAHMIASLDKSALNQEQLELVEELAQWKGDYPVDSYMPSVYHRWEYEVLRFCFEDELGVETTQNLLNTHLSKKFTAPLISKNNSVWFDRVDTAAKEEKSDVMTISFINAYESLIADYGKNSKSWNWGNLHQLEHPHSFGKIALLRPLFNVGPNPIAGAREVINAVNFKYSRTSSNFNANAGPSTRRIIDFSDVEHSISILPTGQSGNPFSDHYDDQVELYNSGKFRPMLLNKEEILKDSKNKLIVH